MATKQNITKYAQDKAILSFTKAIDKAYGSWGYLVVRSFVSGIFIALGATVGFAIIIALIGYILQQLQVLPIIGDFFAGLNEFLDTAATLR